MNNDTSLSLMGPPGEHTSQNRASRSRACAPWGEKERQGCLQRTINATSDKHAIDNTTINSANSNAINHINRSIK